MTAKTKTIAPKTVKSNRPAKFEERSTDETADAAMDDGGPPPDLAKVFSSNEARRIIEVNLRPIETHEFDCAIAGTDLITHRWSEKALKEMLNGQQMTKEEKKLAKNNRAPKDQQEEFEGARYRWDGKDWFPANGIKKAMVSAGFAVGIPRSIVQRCVFVRGIHRRDYVEIGYARCVMREDAVNVGPFGKRVADLRYRPEYQNWTAHLRVTHRADIITQEQVFMLLENAGFSIGIGEWRPEKDGQAGRFTVVRDAAKKSSK